MAVNVGELLFIAAYGFPPEALPPAMIIGTLVDPMATLLNSTGDTVAAMMITRFTEGKGWMRSKEERGLERLDIFVRAWSLVEDPAMHGVSYICLKTQGPLRETLLQHKMYNKIIRSTKTIFNHRHQLLRIKNGRCADIIIEINKGLLSLSCFYLSYKYL